VIRTALVWWLICAALWMVLDDTTTAPELVDGAVAATIGAGAATLTLVHSPLRVAAVPGWWRGLWRPWARLVGELPLLAGVLWRALSDGEREPGGLRRVPFASQARADRRAGQVALACVAGSIAPNAVVVAVDEERGEMLVHELVPGSGREVADPLGPGRP
jgi:hypothetical protein